MKIHLTIFCLLTLAIATAAWADDTSTNLVPPATTASPAGHGGGRRSNKRGSVQNNKKNVGTISGKCALIANQKNPFPSTCSDTQLILSDDKGTELLRTRTDKDGNFSFGDTVAEQSYQITPVSHSYEVFSPKKALHSGDVVDLKIQQK